MKINFVSLSALSILASFVSTEAGVSFDYYFGSAFCAKPIRMQELDGAMIVRLSEKKKRFVPLLYPTRQTPFQWIDSGDVDLLTYEQYVKNPGLFVKPSPPSGENLFVVSAQHGHESGEKDKLAEPAPPSNHFPKPQSHPLPPLPLPRKVVLPGDPELHAFLEGNRIEEKVASNEKPSLSDRMISPPSANPSPIPPPPEILAGNELPAQGTVFADPRLMKEYRRLVNASTLGRMDSKRDQGREDELSVEIPSVPANLKLKASKRTKDGRIQPAQASEFYLTTQNLRELFKDMNVERALSGEIKSVAEIWAHAEKNLNTDPEIALGVKSILLQAKVGRARTDPFGEASLSDLPPDEKYFIIGIDKDENTNVVTIWSKEVEVNPGDNEVELSSNDVIYQD